MRNNPIRTFSYDCRQKFGNPIGKIPLDAGVVCPNRSSGGCIFCRPASFTPECLNSADEIAVQIARGKQLLLKGRFKKFFGYFQQETCTVLPTEQLLGMVEIPLKDPDCVGVIISTRPDCLNPALLSSLAGLILQYDKKCLFELGVQSAHEKSLVLLNRNHTFFDFLESGLAIRAFGCFELSAHLIFGIPGETTREMITTLEQVCSFGVDALKLHHLQVIRDTELEKEFDLGNVKLFTLDDYLDFLVQALAIIPADVTIHRLWTTSSPHLLVAPKWNILASDLSKTLLTKMKREGIYQGMACSTP